MNQGYDFLAGMGRTMTTSFSTVYQWSLLHFSRPDETIETNTSDQGSVAQTPDVGGNKIVPRPTSIENQSEETLITNFWIKMQLLNHTRESIAYGSVLREAEQILSALEQIASEARKDEIVEMKARFAAAFQQLPIGPSQITQLEIDHLKRMTLVPRGVVCVNQRGVHFKQPELSAADLTSQFFRLGFNSVMHARKEENFEGIEDICDVVMLGKKWTRRLWSKTLDELILESSHELREKLIAENYLQRQGYKSCRVDLIKNLKDPEKARRLLEQGLVLFVILTYPEVNELRS